MVPWYKAHVSFNSVITGTWIRIGNEKCVYFRGLRSAYCPAHVETFDELTTLYKYHCHISKAEILKPSVAKQMCFKTACSWVNSKNNQARSLVSITFKFARRYYSVRTVNVI
jgi:hypothetical protein